MMTVVNKFVVSGHQFTMTFLREYCTPVDTECTDEPLVVLTIQSVVCVACVYSVKRTGLITCMFALLPLGMSRRADA
jgi:GDP-mannose transporter